MNFPGRMSPDLKYLPAGSRVGLSSTFRAEGNLIADLANFEPGSKSGRQGSASSRPLRPERSLPRWAENRAPKTMKVFRQNDQKPTAHIGMGSGTGIGIGTTSGLGSTGGKMSGSAPGSGSGSGLGMGCGSGNGPGLPGFCAKSMKLRCAFRG